MAKGISAGAKLAGRGRAFAFLGGVLFHDRDIPIGLIGDQSSSFA
jgi:hypothetical protein